MAEVMQWRAIPGYEGFYEVSDTGRVRRLDHTISRLTPSGERTRDFVWRGRELVLKTNRRGNKLVTLSRANKKAIRMVHHLVLEAFVGPRPEGMECCHYDDDPANNRLSNLRWDTRSENQFDGVRNGLNHQAAKTRCVNGHEFTPENTSYIKGTTMRRCRACFRDNTRRYQQRKKLAQSQAVAS